MKIVIEIPTEFEEHFKSDRFEDSLSRIASDIESFGFQLAGRYEKETITMLREAFKNSTPLPKHHGRLIDADALVKSGCYWETEYEVTDAPTIIEADEGSENK